MLSRNWFSDTPMNIPAQGGMHNDLLQLRYQAAYLIADFKQLARVGAGKP
jgi:hypothetical protein